MIVTDPDVARRVLKCDASAKVILVDKPYTQHRLPNGEFVEMHQYRSTNSHDTLIAGVSQDRQTIVLYSMAAHKSLNA